MNILSNLWARSMSDAFFGAYLAASNDPVSIQASKRFFALSQENERLRRNLEKTNSDLGPIFGLSRFRGEEIERLQQVIVDLKIQIERLQQVIVDLKIQLANARSSDV